MCLCLCERESGDKRNKGDCNRCTQQGPVTRSPWGECVCYSLNDQWRPKHHILGLSQRDREACTIYRQKFHCLLASFLGRWKNTMGVIGWKINKKAGFPQCAGLFLGREVEDSLCLSLLAPCVDDLVSRTQACREQRESGLADGCPQPCSQRGKHGAGEINTPGHEAVSHGHLCVFPKGTRW